MLHKCQKVNSIWRASAAAAAAKYKLSPSSCVISRFFFSPLKYSVSVALRWLLRLLYFAALPRLFAKANITEELSSSHNFPTATFWEKWFDLDLDETLPSYRCSLFPPQAMVWIRKFCQDSQWQSSLSRHALSYLLRLTKDIAKACVRRMDTWARYWRYSVCCAAASLRRLTSLIFKTDINCPLWRECQTYTPSTHSVFPNVTSERWSVGAVLTMLPAG